MSDAHSHFGALVRVLGVLVFVALAACTPDEVPDDRIIGGGGEDDAGSDVTDAQDTSPDGEHAEDVTIDPACEGVDEGGACEIPNAAGVCAAGACRFLSCKNGFRNCDDDLDNGCEADVTLETRCGSCTERCSTAARCQQSSHGYVCATTPVCLSSRLDLDGRFENACEYRVSTLGTALARPGDIDITASDFASDAFWYAGTSANGGVVGTTQTDESPESIDALSTAARARDLVVTSSDGTMYTVWSEGVTVSTSPQSAADESLIRLECAGSGTEQELLGLDLDSPDLLAAEHGIFEMSNASRCEGDQACILPLFDRADYLRSYFPYGQDPAPDVAAKAEYRLSPASFAACDTCFLDTSTGAFAAEKACLGETICARAPSSDDCSGCQPELADCPDFEPIALASNEAREQMVVATRTGVVVLRWDGSQWRAGARAENFAESVVFVAADIVLDGSTATVFLVGDDRVVYVADVSLGPQSSSVSITRPPVGFDVPVELASARISAKDTAVFLLSSRTGAVLARATPTGSVQASIPAPETAVDAPHVVGSAYDRDADAFGLLYNALGQFTIQKVALVR